jgi:HD-like signal output (HDOD) protein
MLRALRREWEMAFANSGQEALEVMARRPYDVIVSDMRMPGMDGAQLLDEVMRRHPDTIRIVLSGQSDQEQILQSMRPTHQYLTKPCSAETLQGTIRRALKLRAVLTDDKARSLVGCTGSVPSLPASYLELMEELDSSDPSIRDIAAIVSRDAAMTAKVLQVANSVLFSRGGVTSPKQAIIRLGLTTLKALVLYVHVFSAFNVSLEKQFGLAHLWDHSVATSLLAKRIAEEEGRDKTFVDPAFTGGLMHDLGKIILAANVPNEYAEVFEAAWREQMSVEAMERDRLGVTHAEIGAYLVGLWGLPDQIVETLAFHHCPREASAEQFNPVTAVYVANILEQEDRPAEGQKTVRPEIDSEYLAELGLTFHLAKWRSVRDSIAEGGS